MKINLLFLAVKPYFIFFKERWFAEEKNQEILTHPGDKNIPFAEIKVIILLGFFVKEETLQDQRKKFSHYFFFLLLHIYIFL